MTRMIVVAALAVQALAHLLVQAGGAEAQGLSVQQNSTRNYLYVIQARSPFHTRSSTLTATTGRTTVTEIVAIGPDPAPLSVAQTGLTNRAAVYQLGLAPNLDIRQQGAVNAVRAQQVAMP
jgi:hypothetical protein